MLLIKIPAAELWDEEKQEFLYTKERTLKLEHSLVSLSKWESKWHRPYMSKREMTLEEASDYVRCMTLTQNVDENVYKCLTPSNMKEIDDYINAPMTATWFSKEDKKNGIVASEKITAEIIYYWMIAFNIPFECQKWHLNRLLTLIRVCSIKSRKPRKMKTSDVMRQNRALNAMRKRQRNTNG